MSHYTTELRYIVNSPYMDIGLKDYPLYNFKNVFQSDYNFGKDYKGNQITNFRDYLNNMLIKHYYFREIGFETATRFIWKLNQAMSEIMIYYNQILESVDLDFNPLWNVDLTETYSHDVEDNGNIDTSSKEDGSLENEAESSTSDEKSNKTTSNTSLNSTKTPNLTNETIHTISSPASNGLTNEEIRAHNYLKEAEHNLNMQTGTENSISSNAEDIEENSNTSTKNNASSNQTSRNTSTTNASNKNTRNETYTRRQYGSSAGYTFPQNLQQWRNIMINSVMQIVEDDKIQELFMNIW